MSCFRFDIAPKRQKDVFLLFQTTANRYQLAIVTKFAFLVGYYTTLEIAKCHKATNRQKAMTLRLRTNEHNQSKKMKRTTIYIK